MAVDKDSNEITAVPKLLELLELTGAVVTLDAMHCQKETTQATRDKGAHYVLTVKANQIVGALRRLALSILKRDTSVKKCSI